MSALPKMDATVAGGDGSSSRPFGIAVNLVVAVTPQPSRAPVPVVTDAVDDELRADPR